MKTTAEQEITPAVDIAESPDGARLTLELPGAASDSISVTVENDTLTIEAERADRLAGYRVIRRESGHGRYRRAFNLSRDLSREDVTADYRNGVLTVRIPKAEHTIPRKIEIRTQD